MRTALHRTIGGLTEINELAIEMVVCLMVEPICPFDEQIGIF